MKKKINISTRAYRDFTSRLREVFALFGRDASTALKALDDYIAHTRDSFADLPEAERLALMMIQPEIDKCLVRSARARERARIRTHIADATITAPACDCDDDDDDPYPISRTERRAMERASRPRMKIKRLSPAPPRRH